MDRIAEANELFDAVLTGSVDLDKKVKNQVSPAKKTSSPYETKSTDENEGSSNKRLALYIGNFPWVSHFPFIYFFVFPCNLLTET